ncbi:hypothetical protein [Halorussus halobius]|uniref:hypothetical protein n=1 Tax=Halorussus halobius TaxID=1710537 RepID=UPI001092F85A|nr:hypothetical protein [Halorussus halobius]
MAYFDAQKTSEDAEYTKTVSGKTCYYNSQQKAISAEPPETFFGELKMRYNPVEFKEQAREWLDNSNGFYTKREGFGN